MKQTRSNFRDLLKLKHAIPSHDTFSDVFCMIDPKALDAVFGKALVDVAELLDEGDVIAIGDKALRGARESTEGALALQSGAEPKRKLFNGGNLIHPTTDSEKSSRCHGIQTRTKTSCVRWLIGLTPKLTDNPRGVLGSYEKSFKNGHASQK